MMDTLMYREMLSAADALRECEKSNRRTIADIADAVCQRGIDNVVTAARGTSKNAGLCFKFYCEVLAGLSVAEARPSISNIYNADINYNSTLYVVISQSGRSPDTLSMLNEAKRNGALTVGITNDSDNAVAKSADFALNLNAGKEMAVAATKTFTAELAVLLSLAAALGGGDADLAAVADKLDSFAPALGGLDNMAKCIAQEPQLIVLSRGITEGIAAETALKITETCYKMVFWSSANEFEHGPKALISPERAVVLLAPDGPFTGSFIQHTQSLKAMGATLYSITDIPAVQQISDLYFNMPNCNFEDAAMIYALAIQYLACRTSVCLGLNPDAPRNLNKITRTE